MHKGYEIEITHLEVFDQEMTIAISGEIDNSLICDDTDTAHGPEDYIRVVKPKVSLYFDNGQETRRIPLPVSEVDHWGSACTFSATYTYQLDFLFWKTRGKHLPFDMSFALSYGNFYDEGVAPSLLPHCVTVDSIKYSVQINASLSKLHFYVNKQSYKRSEFGRVKECVRLAYKFCTLLIACLLLPWYLLGAILVCLGLMPQEAQRDASTWRGKICAHVQLKIFQFARTRVTFFHIKSVLIMLFYRFYQHKSIQANRLAFISMRREEMSGNMAFVYEKIKDDVTLDIQTLFVMKETREWSLGEIRRFAFLCATSKVILVDEFTQPLQFIQLKQETKLIQLWHACGAFKTFGFSRLGKPGGTAQKSKNHRSYDYVTVSSSKCIPYYAEGFGVSDEAIQPTGIARTDELFDMAHKQQVCDVFYQQYPHLENKKLILFAPTFRGKLRQDANYPMDQFDLNYICPRLSEEYVILIKHHPFIEEAHPIPNACRDKVIDVSKETELNDLLFVTDFIITDYSSLVFEASLLRIPMLFYAFDLQEYIAKRDFYFDFGLNVPGKIVYTMDEILDAVANEDYEAEKIEGFASMFFDDMDGKASERIANLCYRALQEN